MKKLPAFLVLAVLLAPLVMAKASNDLAHDTLVYYNMDSGVGIYDDVAANHGSTGGASYYATQGIVNGSYSLNDDSDYIDLANIAALEFTTSENWSASFWVNMSVSQPDSDPVLFTMYDANYADHYFLVQFTGDRVGPGIYAEGNSGDTFTDAGSLAGKIYDTDPANGYTHVVIAHEEAGATNYIASWVNGTLVGNGSWASGSGASLGTSAISFGRILTGSTQDLDGNLDEIAFFNISLTTEDVTRVYNGGTALQWPFIGYFKITVGNVYNNTNITTFSVFMGEDGQKQYYYSTTNGVINTTFQQNKSADMINITFFNLSHGGMRYQNFSVVNVNITYDYAGAAEPFYKVPTINYSDSIYNASYGANYTNNITMTINYSCIDLGTLNLSLFVAGSYNDSIVANCTNESNLVTYHYRSPIEGNISVAWHFNSTYNSSLNNTIFQNNTFLWDLKAPYATVVINFTSQLNNKTFNVTAFCNDSISHLLTYDLTHTLDTIYLGGLPNGSTKTNNSELYDGLNEVNFTCSDYFYSTTVNDTQTVLMKNITLIDEKTRADFDPNGVNITNVTAFFDDNSSFYDFKANSQNSVFVTLGDNTKLRLEIEYFDGTIITRWIDADLESSNTIRICANKWDVIHYEQLILSGTQRRVEMRNVYADCVVAQDYTRFAYQGENLLRAWTIDGQYTLFVWDGSGSKTALAGLDGSVATYTRVDQLEASQEGYVFDLVKGALSFNRTDSTTIGIYYRNIDADNDEIYITIRDAATNALYFSANETASPNNYTVFFNYATLNQSNESLYVITVLATKTDGSQESVSRYFNTQGKTGQYPAAVAAAFAFLMLIFGLTFAAARVTFSWFGVFIVLIAIAALALTVQTWYVLLLEGVSAICLIYIMILMTTKNQPTLT